MSKANDDPGISLRQKWRNISRACDDCKRRKRRCEGPVKPHNKCSNCIVLDLKCTYEKEPKKRGMRKGYVEGIERKIRLLEDLIKQLVPNKAELHSLIYPHDPEYAESLTNLDEMSHSSHEHETSPVSHETKEESAPSQSAVHEMMHKAIAIKLSAQEDHVRDGVNDHTFLSEKLKSLTLKREDDTFHGKSSAIMFMQKTLSVGGSNKPAKKTPQSRRPQYWKSLPWYKDLSPPKANYDFPPPDLIIQLTDAYFKHVDLFYPLFHRPTFDRNVANNLHLTDDGFGSVLLMVCAVGSRYTERIDERTLESVEDPKFLAGWKWYKQVQVVKPISMDPPTLYDIQLYCLAVAYLSRCTVPQTIWTLTGFGIRLALDRGIHRRRVPLERLSIEDELWKRAFWVLIVRDRIISIGVGRPCALDDDNFDLDLPVECDDEYWEHLDPKQRFRQPEGVPSTMTHFNQLIKLTNIMCFAMSTIYAIKTKFWKLIFDEWEHHIVSELDLALNNWESSLPESVRWDPERADDKFFKLSGSLTCLYNVVKILVHRPYIRANGQPSPQVNLPKSLTICTEAARSCIRALDLLNRRFYMVYPYMQFCSMSAGMVVLLVICGNKHSGKRVNPRDMQQIGVCIDVLRKSKQRWYGAAPLLDLFVELSGCANVKRADERFAPVDNMSSPASNAEYSSGISTTTTESSLPSRSSSYGLVEPNEYPQVKQNFELYETPQANVYQSWLPQSTGMTVAATENTFTSLDSMGPSFHLSEGFNANVINEPQVSLGFNQVDGIQYNPSYPAQQLDPYTSYPTAYDTVQQNFSVDTSYAQDQVMYDDTSMAMWLSAPNSLAPKEWHEFFTNFAEATSNMPQNSQQWFETNQQQDTFRMY